MRYSIIIPAYNEQTTITQALNTTLASLRILSGDYEIIVVDDGSTDHTIDHIKRVQAENPKEHLHLIHHTINQGKGAAVKTGVASAIGTYIAFLDADLATHPDELQQAFNLLKESDVAIASRRHPQASITKPQPWYRSWIGQLFNLCLRTYLHLPYRDTQCGCKAFRNQVAKTLFSELNCPGWAFDVELLTRAHLHAFTVSEFPIRWHNGEVTRVRLTHAPSILKDLKNIKRLNKLSGRDF
jgi:glycosyltransferase involved in cell wall biosynthesis